MRTIALAAVLVLIASYSARAQHNGSYTIQQPGKDSVYVDQAPTGGYTIQQPGRDPIYMDRQHDGSVRIQDPSDPAAPPVYIDQQQPRSRY